MSTFEKLLSIGTQDIEFLVANKIKMMNFVAAFTFLISLGYTLTYIFIIKNQDVASINTLFTLAYLVTILFNRIYAAKVAKVWFFTVLMAHLFTCTNLYVTKESGFHLYYFLVPTGAFLLFDLRDKVEKFILSLISFILFFYCENTLNPTPLINLTTEANNYIYQSVIFFTMLEVMVVLSLFVKEIEANEKELTLQATTDPLTNIYNRRYFFERGQLLLKHAVSFNRPYSVILIDLDFFKKINDQFGHHAGDICLKQIALLIKSKCREQDICARIGGEEFAVILPETTNQEASIIAESIRSFIAHQLFSLENEQSFTCTASIGLSSKQSDKVEVKNLLLNADKALYQAKIQGRNRVKNFQEFSI